MLNYKKRPFCRLFKRLIISYYAKCYPVDRVYPVTIPFANHYEIRELVCLRDNGIIFYIYTHKKLKNIHFMCIYIEGVEKVSRLSR